ncbi:MAG: M23 family metallopeptidase [Candidatus Thermoplasmatota archaeon]|nr:M23 family metallopeptidase [Candidatus Thermoplasmatota archaeon]
MKHYPLPKPFRFSKNQESGLFLKERTDRIHCGIDVYAPLKTPVFAVNNGLIRKIAEFTSPQQTEYWNTTYEIILESETNYFFRYAELDRVLVNENDMVIAGDRIGLVGQVLNPDKIRKKHPKYIQKLAIKDKLSMLHFEMYDCFPENSDNYLGGNWFADGKPKGLCDPGLFLNEE